jgi:hypothetical protein
MRKKTMANPNRKYTVAQIRAIRSKVKSAKPAPTPANDVAEARKTLPLDATRIILDLTSAPIERDVTKSGVERVVVSNGGDLKIVAFGEIASMIAATKRVDGYCLVRGDQTKIIAYCKEGFVFNEKGDDWIVGATDEATAVRDAA